MKKKIHLLAFAALLCISIGFAQLPFCGVDFNPNDSLFQKQRLLEQQKLDSLRALNRIEGLLTTQTIPVVVHVLHENGSENITEEKVKTAIDYLNQSFNSNGYYASTPSVNIQFCLVYTDWVHTPSTNYRSSQNLATLNTGFKNLEWNKNRFLNLYVVRSFVNSPTTAGMSKIPGFDDGVMLFDGVIMRSAEFGQLIPANIFGREAPNYTLPHEIGHYCGLFHTFMDDNCNSIGDEVADTPPCRLMGLLHNEPYPIGNGYDTCPNDALGDLENNFMCYNSDLVEPDRFTAGQIAHITDKITIHRPQLLISNGCEGVESTLFEPIELNQARNIFPSFSFTFHRSIMNGNLSDAQDDDRYRVNIAQRGKLTVRLKNLTADFRVALSDINGEISTSQSSGVNEQTLEYFTSFSKELTLRIYANTWNTQNTYTLDVSFESGDVAVTKNINVYEYWFDNNFEQRISTNASSNTFQSNISTNGLANGVHAFNFRAIDNLGLPSPVSTNLFVKQPNSQTANSCRIKSYEFWMNNDFNNRRMVNLSASKISNMNSLIDVNNLKDGLSAFHIRFFDDCGNTSPISTSLFVKNKNNGAISITAYEYWFDDDYQGRINTNLTPITTVNLVRQISTTGLMIGSHTVKFRFKDSKGDWSPTTKDTFSVLSPLPVELSYFNAQCFGNKIELNWTTESEQNNDYFEILRSNSPQLGWQVEKRIISKGNNLIKTNYQYFAETTTKNTYFRLRQVDKDSKEHYSKTIATVCIQNEPYLNIFPNPSNGTIHIETGLSDGEIQIEIYNLLGQLMLSKKQSADIEPVSLQVNNVIIQSGLYLIKVKNSQYEVIGIKHIQINL
jgi:hypothetical protein